ncbi:MAG: ATP-binding protein [Candidatus Pacebacteria bacterium]|nr:ATP-binding protein [Candidatus Paceibacterota bacterium]PIR60880.1 MAG: hypothetical protein COU67_00280 [Candidatus Pacebacteria bacterium CG10_big_fil_rev_8_21_14_0_10_44_54]
MKYTRHLEANLLSHFSNYKQAIVLLGARQTGKTTLLRRLFPDALYILLDNEQTKNVLETYDISTYKQAIGRTKQLIIDELHLLHDPGRAVKIIYDQVPGLQLIVTGSSALHIKNNSTESMAGRKIEYNLFPLTFSEYLVQKNIETVLNHSVLTNVLEQTTPPKHLFSPSGLLEQVLLYGLYPDVLNLPEPRQYLLNLAESAIFKDIVELNLIDNRSKAKSLLELLAYQIGNLCNYSEIGARLSLDRRTVERYIDIFEQSFIVFRIFPYANNKRNEIGKTPKIYFHDLGLRNALIDNYDSITVRSDAGALFENFIIAELKKNISYQQSDFSLNYWRTNNGAEVDIVLSNNHTVIGAEVKMQSGSVSTAFTNRYPDAKTHVITRHTFY